MKSVKPGRGLSAMGFVGSIVFVLFGIFWTIMAYSITRDAPFPLVGTVFPLFGVLFIIIGIANAVYSFMNATGKNRMSIVDIVEHADEPDPLNQRFGNNQTQMGRLEETGTKRSVRKFEGDYCPYCGVKVEDDFDFCPKCGKDI
jgi:hypothetical protein